jgi:hypothetical protein
MIEVPRARDVVARASSSTTILDEEEMGGSKEQCIEDQCSGDDAVSAWSARARVQRPFRT